MFFWEHKVEDTKPKKTHYHSWILSGVPAEVCGLAYRNRILSRSDAQVVLKLAEGKLAEEIIRWREWPRCASGEHYNEGMTRYVLFSSSYIAYVMLYCASCYPHGSPALLGEAFLFNELRKLGGM
jgi:hypothetical protein